MDTIFTVVLWALIAWHVALAVAFSAWCGWEMIIEPAWKLWLRARPTPAVQPMRDLRSI